MTSPPAEAFGGGIKRKQHYRAVACPSVVRNPSRGCCLAGRPKPRSSTRSGAIEKPAAHVLVKDTADQGLVGNALLQGTGTQGA